MVLCSLADPTLVAVLVRLKIHSHRMRRLRGVALWRRAIPVTRRSPAVYRALW